MLYAAGQCGFYRKAEFFSILPLIFPEIYDIIEAICRIFVIRRIPTQNERNETIMPNNGTVRKMPVSKPYLVTRNQALHLSPSNFTQFMTQSTVYGVVVDMPMARNITTTMACYINGAANLYFSPGGDYSGAAQRYPSVVQSARAFVNAAASYIETAKKADTLELPPAGTHFAYILTTGGIYRLELHPFDENRSERDRLFIGLYQRVMNELRGAQMKDKAAGIDPNAAVGNR